MAAVASSGAGALSVAPFETALQEAQGRLLNAHLAALSTLEAELQHMRMENMRLRLRLAEAGIQPESTVPSAASAPPVAAVKDDAVERPSELPTLSQGRSEPVAVHASAGFASAQSVGEVLGPVLGPHGEVAQPRGSVTPPTVVAHAPVVPATASPPTEGGDGCCELLTELLSRYGLQQLPVSQAAGGRWSLGGQMFHLREAEGGDLLASHDGGTSWELLEALLVQHLPQLQALKACEESAAGAAERSERSCSRQVGRADRWIPSSQQYVPPVEGTSSSASAPPGASAAGASYHSAGAAAVRDPTLPAWRSDGLPTFHNAFPQSFNALSGATQYYSQFRVRVPTASQYDSSERNGNGNGTAS